ncbi:MAG: hypothetical protein JXA43_01310 [Candidatus Diapherotrites archaeon]|nr:hypothetical protein [Candidatus Diapherotrites archaeon]
MLLVIPGNVGAMKVLSGLDTYTIAFNENNTYIFKTGETTAELTINGLAKMNFPTFSQVGDARANIKSITIFPDLSNGLEADEIKITLEGVFDEKDVTYREEVLLKNDKVENKVTLASTAFEEERIAIWKIINTYNEEIFHVYGKLNETVEVSDVVSDTAYTQISESYFGMGGANINFTTTKIPDQYLVPQAERIPRDPLKIFGKSIRFGYGIGANGKTIKPDETYEITFELTPSYNMTEETKLYYPGPESLLPFVSTKLDPLMGFVDAMIPPKLEPLIDAAETDSEKISIILNFIKTNKSTDYLKNRPREVLNLDKTALNNAGFLKAVFRYYKIPTKTTLFRNPKGEVALLLKIWDGNEWIYFDTLRGEIVVPTEESIIFEEPSMKVQYGIPVDFTTYVIIGLIIAAVAILGFVVFKFRKFEKVYSKRGRPKMAKQKNYMKFKISSAAMERTKKGEIALMPDEKDLFDYLVLTGGELNMFRAQEKLKYSADLIRSISEKLEEKGIIEEIK